MTTTTMTKNQTGEVAGAENTFQATFMPRFDIWETEEELLLYGDLPGVSPDNLDIRFENKELTIHGRVEARHEGIEFLYGEYGVGDFHRSFAIGEAIDTERIHAELHQGVLTLHLPKSEKAKPRRITVKGG